MRRDEVVEILGRHSEELRERFNVRSLRLFGSVARDESSEASDIDILAEFEPDMKTFDHFMELSFLLEDLFHRRVEVVTPESLSRHIGPHILKEVEYVPVAA